MHKKKAVMSCLVLAMIAAFPSYATTEGVARMNEKWMAETEEGTELEVINYKELEITEYSSEESDVEEIDLTLDKEISPFTTIVSLDRTININTRVLYGWKNFMEGEQVAIAAKCDDSSVVYRIGIRDSAGKLTYVEGSGTMSHLFTIPTNGSYTVYVENRSNKAMKITGSATYLN